MNLSLSITPYPLQVILALCLASSTATAATATWVGKHPETQSWEEPANWSNYSGPQSGIDSVIFLPDAATLANKPNHRSQPMLNGTFIVGDGQQMISAEKTNGVLRINDGGHLVIARGGTLDFASQGQFNLAEGGGTMHLTVEAGATVKVSGFYNGTHIDHTTHFIADQNGVSPIQVKHSAHINGGRLEIDLTHYDLSNGSELILITQLRGAEQTTTFDEVHLTLGWTGTIDYNYSTTDGRAAIALTNLRNNGEKVDIPEPSSYGLILCGFSAAAALIRRRPHPRSTQL